MQIRVLPVSTGPLWLREGWQLFRRQPLGLPAMVVVYVFMLVAPMLLPFIGPAASGVLSPFATLGLMTAVRDTAAGRMPTPAAFAQAFRDPVRRVLLFRLGLINAGLLVLAALGSLLFVPEPPAETTAATVEDFPLRALLMQLLLYLPAIVLMWFAPMLAGWHGLGPA
ncbi:MAG TPA: BPSS1780 family membrane protein, partial [Burkholderiaceae bacterium]|nr:BPSS1780 family membrane protein [Burkholderiaceae bacterium]